MSSTRINTCTQLEWFFTRGNFSWYFILYDAQKVLSQFGIVSTYLLCSLIYCVHHESIWLQEILFALGTLEWFFTSLNPYMLPQVACYPEGLVTLWHCICLTIVFIRNVFDHKKHCLHMAHWHGFTPVWILSCMQLKVTWKDSHRWKTILVC